MAMYLDDLYPETVSLLPNDSRALHAAFDRTASQMYAIILGCAVFDIYSTCDDTDKAYFRRTREAQFG
jgi:hypothetical protein